MMLWVLEDNPSLGFYLRMGGDVVGKKSITIADDNLIELAVGWKDLKKLEG